MADRRVGEAFLELTAKMLTNPVALARAQIDLGPSTRGSSADTL